jgi:transketolase C-terminal domain/subunit
VAGGLGSLVAEVVAERGLACRIRRCAVRTTPDGVSGSQRFMHEAHGLSREALVATALEALGDARR